MDGWQESREHDKRYIFLFGVDLTENMDVAVGEKLCPPFCQGFSGMYPFLSNACSNLAGQVGSGRDISNFARVGSSQVTRPDPTRLDP